jgi:hypothetical protein
LRQKGAIAVAVALLTAACTAQEPPLGLHAADQFTPKWAKTGAAYPDYLRDRNACLPHARSGPGQPPARSAADFTRYKACMTAKGWSISPSGFSPPPPPAIPMTRREAAVLRHQETCTPFQNATRPVISFAASFGCG